MSMKRLLFISAITMGIALGAFSCGEMYSEIPEWSGSVEGIFVVYNGNGASAGSPPIDDATYIEGQEVEVLGNEGSLDRPGYTFIGWNTAPDGSGIPYIQGATFNIGAGTVTLYARWAVNPYDLIYNGNGNTGGPATETHTYDYGDTVTVTVPAGLARTGYTLNGFNTVFNGTGTSYPVGTTFGMVAYNLTLYAQWSINSYTVTYNGNNNTGGAPPAAVGYNYGQTVTVSGNTGALVRTGYTFAGWNTASNGTGTHYDPGDTFPMGDGNLTLYAQWTPVPYTVTYNGNGNLGGTAPVDGTVYYINDTVTILGNPGNLARIPGEGMAEAFKFGGWNTASNGSGMHYDPGDTFPMGDGNLTLYAQWVPFELRDVGPAGGLIFYDKGSFSSGWRYLEAAPDNLGLTIWGDGTEIAFDQTSTVIGAGYQNTQDIIGDENSAEAANLCVNYNSGGYYEWFMPSYSELHLMYQHLYNYGYGGFIAEHYWSSTEMYGWGTYAIHTLNFVPSPDTWHWQFQNANYYVRPVRWF